MYADFLLPHLSDETDLVDVGCGDGELTVDLARSVRSVVGIDVNEADLGRLGAAGGGGRQAGLDRQSTAAGDSFACSAPGSKVGSGKSPSRKGSVRDAVRSVIDTGAGGATVLGKSAPATETRSVLPGVHR